MARLDPLGLGQAVGGSRRANRKRVPHEQTRRVEEGGHHRPGGLAGGDHGERAAGELVVCRSIRERASDEAAGRRTVHSGAYDRVEIVVKGAERAVQ
jgi:hypothetical protein